MKNVRVLFTIKGFFSSFREVVEVADVNDDKAIKEALNKRIREYGVEGKVRELILIEAL
jgi:nitric oxide synthase oxygenase domain/subunit